MTGTQPPDYPDPKNPVASVWVNWVAPMLFVGLIAGVCLYYIGREDDRRRMFEASQTNHWLHDSGKESWQKKY